jgi:hypothetical protein
MEWNVRVDESARGPQTIVSTHRSDVSIEEVINASSSQYEPFDDLSTSIASIQSTSVPSSSLSPTTTRRPSGRVLHAVRLVST